MCLRFERICAGGEEAFFRDCEESSSEWALSCGDGGVEVGCRMTPTPSLLAEPSRPIAMGMLKTRCVVRVSGCIEFASTGLDVIVKVDLSNSAVQHVIVAGLRKSGEWSESCDV